MNLQDTLKYLNSMKYSSNSVNSLNLASPKYVPVTR